ncbi:MAG: isoprenylcysteine carboxylmethyltransferase family protein [Ignavibacteria bacterium]|nr:isoprenylcysteine carboxylmethyltransferase family protein [Ignavibacteria bacterium]
MNFDYLINLIIVINILLTFSANLPLASQAFKKKLQPVLTKANSFLQSLPKTISTLIFVMIIIGLFGVGKVEVKGDLINWLRVFSALLFVVFSWIQIYSVKQLAEYYSPDIVIYKNHQLIDKGFFKVIRHPIYLSQILQDFFAGIALLNIPILVMTLFLEFPLYLKRANLEEEFLIKNVNNYSEYKRRVGKWLPKLINLKSGE